MTPWKEGKANHGHSCVKGRFAYDYWCHPDRIKTPMIRDSIDEPWQEVSWDEAFAHAAKELRRIQAKYGRSSIGGVSSSRCTNEENRWCVEFALYQRRDLPYHETRARCFR
jgi:formate dehydrogenase major subunit